MNNKSIIGSIVTVALAVGALATNSALSANDIVLTANETTHTFNQIGTALDPVIVTGDVSINNVKITGQYIEFAGHILVENSVSHGVFNSGQHIKISGFTVRHSVTENGTNGVCPGTGSWGSAIKIYFGSQDVEVSDNDVYENCGEGIGITRGVDIRVFNNRVRDNFSVNIYLDNSPYAVANNNIVSCTGIYLRNGNRPTGISIAEEYYSSPYLWGAQRHNNDVKDNIIDGCYDGITSWVPEVTGGKLVDAIISGNVITNGIRKSMGISSVNVNVLIENNQVFKAIQVNNPAGVTMRNNIIIVGNPVTATAVLISQTPSPTKTVTPIPASATSTSIPASSTNTPSISATPSYTASPTFTRTPTATPSYTPTKTNTPIAPTLTPFPTPECFVLVHGDMMCHYESP